ncbi:hypothetical protein TrST_g973 [Triparma strigata]|uniref:Peptidase A2 domain-containing protein n=1 Tax=Triparma strigata TaxID=1606541 RepID=A0A9W7BVI4_9STRA|nr:hypothetical protein TrST_g973 [Triparma strigata]
MARLLRTVVCLLVVFSAPTAAFFSREASRENRLVCGRGPLNPDSRPQIDPEDAYDTYEYGGIGVPPPPRPSERPAELLRVPVRFGISSPNFRLNIPVDTGAQVTVLSLSYVRKLGLEKLVDRQYETTASGVGTGTIVGKIHDVKFSVGGETVTVDVMVLDDEGREGSIDGLMGLDLLKKLDAKVDIRSGLEVGAVRIGWVGKHHEESENVSANVNVSGRSARKTSRAHRRPAFVPRSPSPKQQKQQQQQTSSTYIPPVDSEVEAELDDIDNNTIEDIIAAEDKPDPTVTKNYDYISDSIDSDEGSDMDVDDTVDEFDLSGV